MYIETYVYFCKSGAFQVRKLEYAIKYADWKIIKLS